MAHYVAIVEDAGPDKAVGMNDPGVADDLREHTVALVALPSTTVHAAE
jgi:hypothetical protein